MVISIKCGWLMSNELKERLKSSFDGAFINSELNGFSCAKVKTKGLRAMATLSERFLNDMYAYNEIIIAVRRSGARFSGRRSLKQWEINALIESDLIEEVENWMYRFTPVGVYFMNYVLCGEIRGMAKK